MNRGGCTRRTFLKGATALGGAASIGLLPQECHGNRTPTRILGKTGVRVPILGVGTASLGYNLPPRESQHLLSTALDLGLTYIDTAPNYAHAQKDIGQVVKDRRDQVFLATKVHTADGTTARLQLEESLRQLQTDYVDLVQIHSVGCLNIDRVLAPGGTLETLLKAKEQKLTKYIGITSHHSAENAIKTLHTNSIDTAMVPVNIVDRETSNYENEFLPVAEQYGVGVIAMKVFGGTRHTPPGQPNRTGLPPEQFDSALKYSLGFNNVGCAVIGMDSEKQLRENVARAMDMECLSRRG